MVIRSLKTIYKRDLEKLRLEIESYKNEDAIWKVDGDITNSAGNLCLHLIGNLKAFIGAELGGSGYVRHRDLEFSTKGTSRTELLKGVDEALADVLAGLDKLTTEQLETDYPQIVFADKGPMTTGYFLIHLAGHLNWHLGQINYHRRLLDR
jgi:uncharacterized damage-inducible protein DinB